MNERMDPAARKQAILAAATLLALQAPWHHVTIPRLARRLQVSTSLITHYWQIDELKQAVIEHGCNEKLYKIILIGLAEKHPAAMSLPDSVKKQAAISKGP